MQAISSLQIVLLPRVCLQLIELHSGPPGVVLGADQLIYSRSRGKKVSRISGKDWGQMRECRQSLRLR